MRTQHQFIEDIRNCFGKDTSIDRTFRNVVLQLQYAYLREHLTDFIVKVPTYRLSDLIVMPETKEADKHINGAIRDIETDNELSVTAVTNEPLKSKLTESRSLWHAGDKCNALETQYRNSLGRLVKVKWHFYPHDEHNKPSFDAEVVGRHACPYDEYEDYERAMRGI